MNLRRIVPLSLLLVLSGCGSIFGLGNCDSDTEIMVSSDEEVRFWWGLCNADRLTVRDSAGRALWIISGDLESPVTYGRVQDGVHENAGPAEPLVSGNTYRVDLEVEEHDSTLMIPGVEFVP